VTATAVRPVVVARPAWRLADALAASVLGLTCGAFTPTIVSHAAEKSLKIE
jgi:hypothetical protein